MVDEIKNMLKNINKNFKTNNYFNFFCIFVKK